VENGLEFGSCSKSGKLIRTALRRFLKNASDSEVSARLVKVLHEVKKQDLVSARGDRHPANGLLTQAGKNLLKNFNFNAEAPLSRLIKTSITVDAANYSAGITAFKPAQDLQWPGGATHFSLKGGWLHLDLANNTFELAETNILTAAKHQPATNILLQAASPPTPYPVKLFVLKLEFLQEINGVQYQQLAARLNGCAVEVAG
jgi:hypothetical protein